jgi:hypothetical protein
MDQNAESASQICRMGVSPAKELIIQASNAEIIDFCWRNREALARMAKASTVIVEFHDIGPEGDDQPLLMRWTTPGPLAPVPLPV